MADNTTYSEAEVVDPGGNGAVRPVTVNPVQFNIGTTLRSPFFWLVAGLALGVWLCKSRKL